jgi:AraC-like DNA-binding protein
MQTLLLVGLDEDTRSRVCDVLPDGWLTKAVPTFGAAVRVLLSRDPPQVMLFTSDELSEDVRRSLIKLSIRGYTVPSAVLIRDLKPSVVHLAGRVHRHDVRPIFGMEDLDAGIGVLIARAGRPLSSRLERVIRTSNATWRSLIGLLEADRSCHTASPEKLAAKLGVSRSGLYRRLRQAGLPSPHAVQELYRLWPGVQRVVGGGSGEDAAFEADRPHPTAFRRAVARHFGMSLKALREVGDLDRVLKRWVAHQIRVGSTKGSTR